jgi:hypothetical protein
MSSMDGILCPTCPLCDKPPTFALSPLQAFCGTDGCPTFCWNMTVSAAENRRNFTVHDLDRRDETHG